MSDTLKNLDTLVEEVKKAFMKYVVEEGPITEASANNFRAEFKTEWGVHLCSYDMDIQLKQRVGK